MNLPFIFVPLSSEFYFKIELGRKYEIMDCDDKVVKYLKDRKYDKVILGKMGTRKLAQKLSNVNIQCIFR